MDASTAWALPFALTVLGALFSRSGIGLRPTRARATQAATGLLDRLREEAGGLALAITAEGRIAYASQELANLLGRRPEAMLQEPLRNFVTAPHWPRVKEALRRARRDGHADCKFLGQRTDDTASPIGFTLIPIRDPQAGVTYLCGFDGQHTEEKAQLEHQRRLLTLERIVRRAAEGFLRGNSMDETSQALLEGTGQLLEVSRAYIFRLRSDGMTADNTQEWCATGVKPQIELLQGVSLELVPWWLERCLRGELIDVPDVSKLPEPTRSVLEQQQVRAVLAVPFFLSGRLAGFLGFDQTHRPRAWRREEVEAVQLLGDCISQALQHQRTPPTALVQDHLLRVFVDQLPISAALRDPEGRYLHVNRWCSTLFGKDLQNCLGRTPSEALSPEPGSKLEKLHREAVESGQPVSLACETRLQDRNRNLQIFVSPLRSETGIISGTLEVVFDTSDLETAKALALTAVHERNSLLDHLSQTLRVHMNNLLGMVDLAHSVLGQDSQSDYLRTARQHGHSLMNALNDISDLGRLMEGNLTLDLVNFDLNHVLDRVEGAVSGLMSGKGLLFDRDVEPDTPLRLGGDPGRLHQVLLHLVRNALEYTDAGRVALLVRREKSTDERLRVRFVVSDTGMGISEEARHQLFLSPTPPGAQLPMRSRYALGLTLASRLVERMGGKLELHTQLGTGTTAQFVLPFAPPVELLGPATAEELSTEPFSEPIDLVGVPVILGDGDWRRRRAMEKTLTALGCLVTTVAEGHSALRLIQGSAAQGMPFRLALLDLLLPERDGPSVSRELAANPETRHLPVVILVSAGMRGDSRWCADSSCAAYVTLPIPVKHLERILRRTLQRNLHRATTDPSEAPHNDQVLTRHTLIEDPDPPPKVPFPQIDLLKKDE